MATDAEKERGHNFLKIAEKPPQKGWRCFTCPWFNGETVVVHTLHVRVRWGGTAGSEEQNSEQYQSKANKYVK